MKNNAVAEKLIRSNNSLVWPHADFLFMAMVAISDYIQSSLCNI